MCIKEMARRKISRQTMRRCTPWSIHGEKRIFPARFVGNKYPILILILTKGNGRIFEYLETVDQALI